MRLHPPFFYLHLALRKLPKSIKEESSVNTFKRHRVVMATFGSLGDLHPYIGLALEMKKRYLEPVIATSNIYRQRIESLGIEFHPMRPDMPEEGTPEYVAMMEGVIDPNRGS